MLLSWMTKISLHKIREVNANNVKPETRSQLRNFVDSYVSYYWQTVGCNRNTNLGQPKRKQFPSTALILARGLIQIFAVRNHSHAICHSTNCMKRSPSKANSFSSSQKIPARYKTGISITVYEELATCLNPQPHKSLPHYPILVI